ncbi:MAG TPA: hypothetical protein VGJ92_05475 [Methanocella sp.]
MSGCLFSLGQSNATPTPAATGTPWPQGSTPTSFPVNIPPGETWAWTPGSQNNNGNLSPTSSPGTNGTSPATPTPQPVVSATVKDWGTSKDTYARGDTATGWVYVTNTGNVPINAVDFTIVIKKTVFFVPIEKSYDYSKTGLNIAPGETKQVEFSQSIPSEYSGVSTAGDYQLKVTAKLAGKEIGTYSKGMKIV